jgi:exonuclease SbcC
MLLKSLALRNIRSYIDERITFPEGIVLLAGDIGAGKSTILLAIEFALFGLLRSDLSGAALLRNGARQGTVELTFELDGKPYTICRTLKRTKTSVEQDAGFFVEKGLRQELTAIELKSRVLSLLGYPGELVTKSKNLIYRYTVYTPQEEMKRIILEDKESRLTILRKVFDIDKYRRIADNAATYAKLLREQQRAFEGQLADEPLKRRQYEEKQQQARAIQQAVRDIQPRLSAAQQAVAQQRTALEQLETERSALAAQRAAFEAADAELRTLARHQEQITHELAQLQTMLAQAPPAPTDSPQDIAQALQKQQNELARAEQEFQRHIAARAGLLTRRSIREEATRKILSLNQCPVCLQQVDATHKHTLAEQEQRETSALMAQLAQAEESLRRHEQIKKNLQATIQAFQQQHASAQEALIRHQHHQQHTQRKQQLETRLGEVIAAITAAGQHKQAAASALQGTNALETRYLAEKGKLDALLQQEQHVIVEHATLRERATLLTEAIALLEHDLAAKQHARTQLEKLSTLHNWLDEFFTNLMTVMEKHVLTKVYHEFNDLFVRWFSLLIDDELLVARLDEVFSPVIQQNGYDTDVENLSGGEKTACALAYRLALNTVIAAVHSSVRTKDMVILDEPTDGFSADQISRMRDVLDQLSARQVLLVSHEAMIESLADHVLRVVKEEHTSRVLV